MKKLVALLAVLSMVSVASANITAVVSAGTDVGNGLKSYTVNLVSDNGQFVTAFDGGFTGSMNQIMIMNMFGTPQLDFSGNPISMFINASQDSHFLFNGSQMAVTTAPIETANTLSGIFGIKPAGQGGVSSTNLALAQIVLPTNALPGTVVLSGRAADAIGTKYNVSASIPVPEPATLGLLAMGVVGLLRRKHS